MDGPTTGNSKKGKLVFIALIWCMIIAAIFLVLFYGGVIESVKDDIKQDRISSLTSTFTSDITIRVAEDGENGYDGYAVLRSKKHKQFQEASGIELNITGDSGDYYTRTRKLISGEYDIAVMPIHDYLEQISSIGVESATAPVLVAAISGSIGADASVSNPKLFKTINDLKGLKKISSCYTSKFMLGSLAVDAGIPELLKGTAYQSIDETFKALMSGKCKVAGLWEPYISMAKKKGFTVLMDSSELQLGKITDVFLVNRSFMVENEKYVQAFFDNYFKATDHYLKNMTDLYGEIEVNSASQRSKIEIAETLGKVKFFTLGDNAYTLFKGHPSSELEILDNIDAVVSKLLKMGSVSANPLSQGDARSIVTHKVISGVFHSYDPGEVIKPAKEAKVYSKLSLKTWNQLIRTPKFSRDDLAITFLRDGKLNSKAKSILDTFASEQIGNFDYYIAIVGKSGQIRGVDEVEIVKRTQKKADRVYKYLQKYYQIDPNRIKSIGMGSALTPRKTQGERYNTYLKVNNKVEILFIAY